ncbi:hypothetical protein [Formosa algae]|uniref:hypothetical protein n=1 Tax=Formosa algae TaxID=225843 RepID=UPI000CCFA390|nr:hypothetical protein [Formosa algae]PNW28157.1 hypothetical protein BKP44_09780 [Formosa algae]
MRIVKQPLFLLALAIASFIYLANIIQLQLPDWISFYVNDALCMPIVLSFCLLGVRVIKKNSELYLPVFPILLLTVFYAVFFEYYLPNWNPRYTADWIDVGLYALGSLVFYRFQKKFY